MKVSKEDIQDYIFDEERWHESEIVCPYCKYKHTEVDPYTLYSEKDNEKFECEICGRKFLLTSGFDWWYTTTPIESEVEKILEEEQE